jgi:hypothetical protein
MPDLDGGHYFFTALVPVCNQGIVAHAPAEGSPRRDMMKSSPIHMVREALETLPTALQSRVAEEIGIQSPFARSARTHFARFVVIDQPFFNGRVHVDSLAHVAGAGGDLLTAGPVDSLACPYLLVAVDFDPADPAGKGEPRAYFEHLWGLMPRELEAVFAYCYGFSKVKDAASFADFILPCQLETTMPFNDYWVGAPQLKSLSGWLLGLAPAAALLAGFAVPISRHWHWWQGLLFGLGLLALALFIDVLLILRRAAQPFAAAPGASLRHVLKALYLQQAFTRFAIARQGAEPASLGPAFRAFLDEHKPADLDGPTQKPGIIRSHFPGPAG